MYEILSQYRILVTWERTWNPSDFRQNNFFTSLERVANCLLLMFYPLVASKASYSFPNCLSNIVYVCKFSEICPPLKYIRITDRIRFNYVIIPHFCNYKFRRSLDTIDRKMMIIKWKKSILHELTDIGWILFVYCIYFNANALFYFFLLILNFLK